MLPDQEAILFLNRSNATPSHKSDIFVLSSNNNVLILNMDTGLGLSSKR